MRKHPSEESNSNFKFLLTTKTNGGFTLIELIVSVAIIAILTSVAIAGLSTLSTSNEVVLQVQDISSQARKIRNDALASKFPPGCEIVGTTLPIFYGTYLTFDSTDTTRFETGSICYDRDSFALTKVSQLTSYNSGVTHASLTLGGGSVGTLSIVYLKTGVIKLLNNSTMVIGTITAAPTATDDTKASVVFSKTGTTSHRLNFNSAGLICEEKGTPSPSCVD